MQLRLHALSFTSEGGCYSKHWSKMSREYEVGHKTCLHIWSLLGLYLSFYESSIPKGCWEKQSLEMSSYLTYRPITEVNSA